MSGFTAGALARMRSIQEDHMPDTCEVLAGVETQNAYGEVVRAWNVAGTYSCGFNPLTRLQGSGGGELNRPEGIALETEARLRLPAGTPVTPANRIRLTHRFGVALATPVIYEISGPVKSGPAAILLNLRRVDL